MSLLSTILDLVARSPAQAPAEQNEDTHESLLRGLSQQPGNWSTIGEFSVDFLRIPPHLQRQLQAGVVIGSKGAFGTVRRIVYQGLPLAKKTINAHTKEELEVIKQEVVIAQKVQGHRHIVQLVGTYEELYEGSPFLHMLMYPVAVCDLDRFLDDCEALKRLARELLAVNETGEGVFVSDGGMRDNDVEMRAIQIRAKALGRDRNLRLCATMGCVTKAVKWIHSQDVQHLDLKPQNILLTKYGVYLTDFGISRGKKNSTTQSFPGYSAGYCPPEVLQGKHVNPAQADIYSLGCIFLHILTIWIGRGFASREKCMSVLVGNVSTRDTEIRGYIRDTIGLWETNREINREWIPLLSNTHAPNVYSLGHPAPFVVEDLLLVTAITIEDIAPILSTDREKRPDITSIDRMLWKAGGSRHRFHGTCCHSELMNIGLDESDIHTERPEDSRSWMGLD